MISVASQFELERRVADVEMPAETVLERVEHDSAPAVGKHVRVHHDMHRQDRQP